MNFFGYLAKNLFFSTHNYLYGLFTFANGTSRNLAYSVQNEFTIIGRENRDAKQRAVGIWVLQAVAMPAILVELGFISNPEEEDYLNSSNGQKELAESVARAVKQYKKNIENKMNINNR